MVPAGLGDLFCSGHTWLPDGRLFVAGGNAQYSPTYRGSRLAYIWDPNLLASANQGWIRLPDLQIPRWYPTVTLTGDGKVMVSGGREDTVHGWCNLQNDRAIHSYEVWDISAGQWETAQGSLGQVPAVYDGPDPSGCSALIWEYPRQHLVSTNEVFMAGMTRRSDRVEFLANYVPSLTAQRPWESRPTPTGGWPVNSGDDRFYGTSVLVPNIDNAPGGRDLLMTIGGASGSVARNTWQTIDAGAPSSPAPQWSAAAPLWIGAPGRMFPNAVLLPNADIFVSGGTSTVGYSGTETPVMVPAIYRKNGGWSAAATQVHPRRYHSTAALLPSGRVVTAGGEGRTADYEIYEPAYLAPTSQRPQFAGAWAGGVPPLLERDTEYVIDHVELSGGVSVNRVVLMRPCSTTHHHDADQRYVELVPSYSSELASATAFAVLTPKANATSSTARGSMAAPPGYYMMFLISSQGVPSVAKWVILR
jgi:galactose oxidase